MSNERLKSGGTMSGLASPLNSDPLPDSDNDDIAKMNSDFEVNDEDFAFNKTLALELAGQIDENIAKDIPLKNLNFTTHEFIKINQVGTLINDAIQSVIDKLNVKDKITQANKAMIRQIDQRQKNMEASVNQLLKLSKQVTDQHMKMKAFQLDLDALASSKNLENSQAQFAEEKRQKVLEMQEAEKNNMLGQIQLLFEKSEQTDIKIDDIYGQCTQKIFSAVNEIRQQFQKQNDKIDQIDYGQDKAIQQFQSLFAQINFVRESEFKKIFAALQLEQTRMLDMELEIRKCKEYEAEIKSLKESINQLLFSANEAKQCQLFCERFLPLLTHLQISEGLHNVVSTDAQRQSLINYDKEKLNEYITYIQSYNLLPANLSNLRNKIEGMGKYLQKEGRGSVPFTFGPEKIYQPDTSTEKFYDNETVLNIRDFNFSILKQRDVDLNQKRIDDIINDFSIKFENRITDVIKPPITQTKVKKLKLPESALSGSALSQTQADRKSSCNSNDMPVSQSPPSRATPDGGPSIQTQSPEQYRPITIKYITKVDKKRLQKIEQKQQSFMRAVNAQYQFAASDYETQFSKQKNDQDQLRHQILSLNEVVSLMQNFISSGDLDKEKLKEQLKQNIFKIERNTKVQIESARSLLQAEINTLETVIKNSARQTERSDESLLKKKKIANIAEGGKITAQISVNQMSESEESKLKNPLKESVHSEEKKSIFKSRTNSFRSQKLQENVQILTNLQPQPARLTEPSPRLLSTTQLKTPYIDINLIPPLKEQMQTEKNENNPVFPLKTTELEPKTPLSTTSMKPLSQKVFDQVQNATIEELKTKISEVVVSVEVLQQNLSEAYFKIQQVVQDSLKLDAARDLERVKNIIQGRFEEEAKIIKANGDATEAFVGRRLNDIENEFKTTQIKVAKYYEICDDLNVMFKRDYDEFIRDRKRWKSDFDTATQMANNNFNQLQDLLNQCTNQNRVNTSAIKMMLDVQMIAQLCEKQDIEDKKQLGLFGLKKDRDQISPPVGKETEKSPRGDDQMLNHVPQVLKVDRNCLQCSNNMSQVVHQLKLACLSYTSAPITYREKQYQVSDLLKVKANVISDCQRLVREQIFKGKNHDGATVYNHSDERSFIIGALTEQKGFGSDGNRQVVNITNQNFIDVKIKSPAFGRRSSTNDTSKTFKASRGSTRDQAQSVYRERNKSNTMPSDTFEASGISYLQSQSLMQESAENKKQQQAFDAFLPITSPVASKIGARKKIMIGKVLDMSTMFQDDLNSTRQDQITAVKFGVRPMTQASLPMSILPYDVVRGISSGGGGINNRVKVQESNQDRKYYLKTLSIDGHQIYSP